MSKLKSITNYLLPVFSVLCVFLLWWWAAKTNELLASPMETIDRFIELIKHPKMGVEIHEHIIASVIRIIVSFVLASFAGITLGVLFGIFPTFKRIVWPVFSILRPIPPLAWIPIVVLWVGLASDASKIIIIFIGIVMAVVINTYAGISQTDELIIKAGKTLGASKWQILTNITLPNSIPAILAGMKTGLSTGWMSLVAAEMMAAEKGIGFLINDSLRDSDTALNFVGIVLVALCSSLLTVLLNVIERCACPWLKIKSK